MSRALSLALPLLLAMSSMTSRALAAPSELERARALELFEQSAEDYREGRFQVAIDKLLAARALKREPVLLYNLARAYEALGRWEEAARAYEQYLAEEPAAPDRKAIEGRVQTLDEHVAALAAGREAQERRTAVASPPLPRPSEPVANPVLPWLVVGAGAAFVTTGVAFGVAANDKHDSAVAEPTQARAVDLHEGAKTLTTVANVAVVAGVVLAAAGFGWVIVRATRGKAARDVAFSGAGLRTVWSFP